MPPRRYVKSEDTQKKNEFFCVTWKWNFYYFFIFFTFLLLRDNKNISLLRKILNNVKSKNLVFHEKQFCVETNCLMLHKKLFISTKKRWCYAKAFHVDKNKMMPWKKRFLHWKNLLIIPERRAITNTLKLILKITLFFDFSWFYSNILSILTKSVRNKPSVCFLLTL